MEGGDDFTLELTFFGLTFCGLHSRSPQNTARCVILPQCALSVIQLRPEKTSVANGDASGSIAVGVRVRVPPFEAVPVADRVDSIRGNSPWS